jgi:hypothetical protein
LQSANVSSEGDHRRLEEDPVLDLANQFLAFCRSKPADEVYDFYNIYDCACGQFGQELSLLKDDEPIGGSEALIILHSRVMGPLHAQPWTFGALTTRLEAALSAPCMAGGL